MNRKKSKQSQHKKGYYEKFARELTSKKHKRAIDREKRIEKAREHPEVGSPSQIKWRKKHGLLSKKNTSDS